MAKVRIVQPTFSGNKFDMSQPDIKVNRTLKPVDREHSNMEIEKGEYVVTNTANTGLPETYIAGGKRHSENGTPVNLPADSFIFSRDNKMKIRDEDILKMFGKTGNKAMTPADLAKQYDINKYRQILADNNSDKLQVETAELMIANYNEKLGKLALVQESLKGFPDSIPKIAMPYLEASKFDPANITDPTGDTTPGNMDQAKYGAQVPVPEMYPALYQMGGGQPFLNYSQMPQANAQQQMLNSVVANNAAQIQQNKQMWNQDNNPVNLDQRSIMQGMWDMAQAVDPTPVTNIANMGVNKLRGVNQEMGDVAGVFASMIPGIKNAKKVKNFLGALDKGDDVYNVATAAYQMGGMATANVDYIFLDGGGTGDQYVSELDKLIAQKKQQELDKAAQKERNAMWASGHKEYEKSLEKIKELKQDIKKDTDILEVGLGIKKSNVYINRTASELEQLKNKLVDKYKTLDSLNQKLNTGKKTDISKMVIPQYTGMSNPFPGGNYAPLMTNVRTQQTSALPEQTPSASRRDDLVNEIMDPKNTQPAPKLKPATGGKKLKKEVKVVYTDEEF